MAQHVTASGVGAFLRRAVQALGAAFDPAREADGEDTVFQPRGARERAEPAARRRIFADADSAPIRPAEETLQ